MYLWHAIGIVSVLICYLTFVMPLPFVRRSQGFDATIVGTQPLTRVLTSNEKAFRKRRNLGHVCTVIWYVIECAGLYYYDPDLVGVTT